VINLRVFITKYRELIRPVFCCISLSLSLSVVSQHLGHNRPYHPTCRGFQSWLGLPYSGDMGCIDNTPQGCKPFYNRSQSQPACPALCPSDSSSDTSKTAVPLYDAPLPDCAMEAPAAAVRENNSARHSLPECDATIKVAPFDATALNARYVARARRLIESHAEAVQTGQTSKAMFLYVAFAHTHTPLGYDETKFGNASQRPGYKRVFGNTLAEVDSAIGDILEAIAASDAMSGNKTLVIVTSDNGPADLGSVDCDMIGSQGPYQGLWQKSKQGGGGGSTAKGTEWEGGHRVVGLASWPGVVSPGVSNALVGAIDVVPTFLALSGVALPTDRSYDGMDISPILLSTAENDTAHVTMFHPSSATEVPAMRLGKYKAYFRTFGASPCRIEGEAATHAHVGLGKSIVHDPPLVFDLEADAGESMPVDPGPDVMAKIKAAHDAFWADVNSTLRSKTKFDSSHDARPCGNKKSACCRKNE
jgi:hypothetical protein